ncbi:hypothetical protein RN001_009481 [Aquatica leii]|uniref:Uncharacterized protein n=1 Tax=Aquatica leii TaxID=1421715 RepID=A0AAN7SPY6_9COLE|nr:hypothetical protein RN001_009481 [Aquatica leii]
MLLFLIYEDLYLYAYDTLNFLMEEFNTHKYTIKAEVVTRRVTKLCIVYYTLAFVNYITVPFIDYSNCVNRNTSDTALTCGLPSPESLPFDTTKNPGYAITYILQALAAGFCIKSATQPLMTSASIIYHIIGHLYMIQDELTSLFEQTSNERKDKLKQIIRHHSAVIELNNSICKGLNQMLLMYTVMLAIIFSVCGFQMLNIIVTKIEFWAIQRYLVVFLGYSMICWFLSFLGQMLMDESTRVATCAYNIEWYTESLEFQHMIKFLILRANEPLVVRSASISNVSFGSFAKVVSTTYSYLAMMYKMMILNETK